MGREARAIRRRSASPPHPIPHPTTGRAGASPPAFSGPRPGSPSGSGSGSGSDSGSGSGSDSGSGFGSGSDTGEGDERGGAAAAQVLRLGENGP